MAFPLLRWSCRRTPAVINSYFRFDRFVQNQTIAKGLAPLAAVVCGGRFYSSDHGDGKQHQKFFVMDVPDPFLWFRVRFYFFLIRTYCDKEFNVQDFTEGARHAFSHVSRLLSQCQFDALEGLVAKDLIGKLKEKFADLPLSHKRALSADPDKITYTTLGNMGFYYDNNGRKFVSILVRFWYLTSEHLPEDTMDEVRIFQVAIGGVRKKAELKRPLRAIYEFQREFTQGATSDWIITRIEHSKLLK